MSNVRPYIGECLGFKGATHNHAHLGLPDKGLFVTFAHINIHVINKIWFRFIMKQGLIVYPVCFRGYPCNMLLNKKADTDIIDNLCF